ncbi:MAG: cell division protein SepF [Rothia sp. (in: high G+C Gram-positive bacteria)]|nr:cell division protein SepF [Rothia sp. (in: high G+C Gram-positive bacteria)]
MARTLHQAMAYLGLAENETERAQQSARNLEPVYEETVFAADDAYEPYEGEDGYVQPAAHTSANSDRDVLLGIQTAEIATAHQQSPAYSQDGYRTSEPSLATETFEQGGAANVASSTLNPQPTSRFPSDESDEELRRITTIHPRSYNDAKIIGESFRENIPVIMNVTEMGDMDAKRLVDFSAGLAFALHGSIERVTDKVFLLTPANLEVLGAEGTEVPVSLDADDSPLFNQG